MVKQDKVNKISRKSCKQTLTAAEEVDIETYEDAEKLMKVILTITKERSDPSFTSAQDGKKEPHL
ncbi:MAG: hypothetical protein K6F32_05815 [Bacilli bacterium]|nr:hypothetical protein [Bacilli bacterium]